MVEWWQQPQRKKTNVNESVADLQDNPGLLQALLP